MNEQQYRFRIGLFTLVGFGALIVILALFSNFTQWFTPHSKYTIVFADAGGVAPGTHVRRSGVRIGEVVGVHLEDNGKVMVSIQVDRPNVVWKDEEAVISRTITGEASIDLIPTIPALKQPELFRSSAKFGNNAVVQAAAEPKALDDELILVQAKANPPAAPQPQQRVPLEPGGVIPGAVKPDLSNSFGDIQKAVDNFNRLIPSFDEAVREVRDLAKATKLVVPDMQKAIQEIEITSKTWRGVGENTNLLINTNAKQVEKALENLNDTLVRIAQVFNDENQKNLSLTLKNVRGASDGLDSITKTTDALLRDSRVTLSRINSSLTQTDKVLANMEKLTKPLADHSESISRNLDESTIKLNKTLSGLQDLMGGFSKGDGTLQRLLNDPALYNNLNEAACMVAKIMPRLDRAMRDFEVFADKIARHPESLGVGGAVRPSSGLK